MLRTHRHFQNLRAIVGKHSDSAVGAQSQLLAAIKQDAKHCPYAALACSWVTMSPTEGTLDYAAKLLHQLPSEARKAEREARREKW